MFTDECRSGPAVRMNDTIFAVRYHPPTIVGHFKFEVPLLTIGWCASSKHPKISIRWTVSKFWKKLEFSFSRELGYKLVYRNALIRRSHAVNEWKTRNGIQYVPWPAHSPNLNPTENVWAFLEGTVCDIWNKIPNKLVLKLFEGMPKRIEKCISSTGFPTKY